MKTPKRRTLGFAHDEQIRWRYRNGCSVGTLAKDYGLPENDIAARCEGLSKVGFYETVMRTGMKRGRPNCEEGAASHSAEGPIRRVTASGRGTTGRSRVNRKG